MTRREVRQLGTLELRAEPDGRTLTGTVVPYHTDTRIGHYVETFLPGAFADATTTPETTRLLVAHEAHRLPIGRAVTLTEEARGLLGDFLVSRTASGDDVLALAADGVRLGLSVGFVPLEDRWTRDRSRVERVRATLVEVSVVGVPAYEDALVASVRSEQARTFARRHAARLYPR